MLLSFFLSSSLFSRGQAIIWVARAPVALILCSAHLCFESLLRHHKARCQSPGGISISPGYLPSSDKTHCSEMLDLVYEAVAISCSLTDYYLHTVLWLQSTANQHTMAQSSQFTPATHREYASIHHKEQENHPCCVLSSSYFFSFLLSH